MYDIGQVIETYNELTNRVKQDLNEQYELGRLAGADYANVYATLMAEILRLSFEAPLRDKDIELRDKELEIKEAELKLAFDRAKTEEAHRKLLKAQEQLTIRQTEGFDENIRLQLFKAQLDGYAMIYNSGLLTGQDEILPDVFKNRELASIYKELKSIKHTIRR